MRKVLALVLIVCLCLSGVTFSSPSAQADTSLAWEQVGQPMGKVWWPIVDPKDANHVYVVTEQGLYRSLDAGLSWTRLWAGAISWEMQIFYTSATRYLFICNQANAFYSTDDGTTWHPLNPPNNYWIGTSTASILATSIDGEHVSVFVGDRGGISRSTDLGKTWQKVSIDQSGSGFGAYYLYGCASNPGFVLAATFDSYGGSETRGLYRSFDGGTTWTRGDTRSISVPSYSPTFWVLVHPSDPRVLSVVSADRVFRSTDCGDTWTETMNGLQVSANSRGFVRDAANPEVLFLWKGDELFVSHNMGDTWVKSSVAVTQRDGTNPWPLSMAAFSTMVQSTADPDVFYATAATALYLSRDHARTWYKILETDMGELWSTTWTPDGSRVYATGNHGIWVSVDGARSWSVCCDYPGVVCQSAVTITGLVAVARENRLLTSSDGGASWKTASTPSQLGIVVIDPRELRTIYAADFLTYPYIDTTEYSGKTYKSTDAGLTWTPLAGGLPGKRCMAMAISPFDSKSIMWASRREVYLSKDAGVTWKPALQLGQPCITSTAAFSRTDARTMYVSTETDGVLRSTDGGATWGPATAGMSVAKYWNLLALEPASPYRLFMLTAYGVFESDDGAGSWVPVNSNAVGTSFKQLSCPPASGGSSVAVTSTGLWMRLGQRLQPPADVKAVSQKNAIGLTWSSVTAGSVTPVAYDIWRSTDAGFAAPVRVGRVSAGTTSYTDATTWGFKPYYYKIGAWDGRETSEQVLLSSAVSATALDDVRPVITLKSPVANPWTSADSACSLSFSVVDNETGIASVTVDGSTADLYGYAGTYTRNLTLVPGWQQMLIVARDIAGNTTQLSVRIRYIRTTVVQIHPAAPFVSAYISPGYRPVSVKTVRNRTFVPVRDLAEALGAQVSWDAGARKATLTRGTTTIVLWIGNRTALVNGARAPIDVKDAKVFPFIEGDKTYMPVNFVASSFGAVVGYDAATRVVTVTLSEG